jgi:hypothetical protein
MSRQRSETEILRNFPQLIWNLFLTSQDESMAAPCQETSTPIGSTNACCWVSDRSRSIMAPPKVFLLGLAEPTGWWWEMLNAQIDQNSLKIVKKHPKHSNTIYHIISYYIISYHIILYYTILFYHIILYFILLYYIIYMYDIMYCFPTLGCTPCLIVWRLGRIDTTKLYPVHRALLLHWCSQWNLMGPVISWFFTFKGGWLWDDYKIINKVKHTSTIYIYMIYIYVYIYIYIIYNMYNIVYSSNIFS